MNTNNIESKLHGKNIIKFNEQDGNPTEENGNEENDNNEYEEDFNEF